MMTSFVEGFFPGIGGGHTRATQEDHIRCFGTFLFNCLDEGKDYTVISSEHAAGCGVGGSRSDER